MLGTSEDEEARGRWALRREYRSSYRDTANPSDQIVEGRWWEPGEWQGRLGRSGGDPVPVALDAGVARELGVDVGDEPRLGRPGRAGASRVACLREVDWAASSPTSSSCSPRDPWSRLPTRSVTLLRVDDPQARGRLQRG